MNAGRCLVCDEPLLPPTEIGCRIPSSASPAGGHIHGAPESRAAATRLSSSSAVTTPGQRESVALDPLEEALLELAKSAIRNRREVAERRGKMVAVEGGNQGGRTA